MKIYATLLDKFDDYLKGRWNTDERAMLDTVNRVPRQVGEAAQKGTAFHELTIEQDGYFKGWWNFPEKLTDEIRAIRRGAMHEVYVSRPITVRGRQIELYGYLDDYLPNLVRDLKTGNSYYQLKFADAFQWRVYLYITKAQTFEYPITDFSTLYYEQYHQYPELEQDLIAHLEKLVDWLDWNRPHITDLKIFQEIC
jgi:hypothetical protein